MEKTNKKKLKPNAKLTKIKCLRCNCIKEAQRNDAKFCSDLCRVQERNDRIEKGYDNFIVNGTLHDVKEYFNKHKMVQFCFGFYDELNDLQEHINDADMSVSWKIVIKGILVYYIANNKKKPFEIYFNDNYKTKLATFELTNSLMKMPQIKANSKTS
jgi:hypothetical protein